MSKVMTAEDIIMPFFPMICGKKYTSDEKLKFILTAMKLHSTNLLEEHKEYIKENANYEVGNFLKKDIDEAHKQFLANL